MWQRYLRRPTWLQVLTVFLVAAGVILAATKDYLPGGALIVVALVVSQLGPKVIEWVEGLRTQHQEEASLLRIRGPIGEVDPFKEGRGKRTGQTLLPSPGSSQDAGRPESLLPNGSAPPDFWV